MKRMRAIRRAVVGAGVALIVGLSGTMIGSGPAAAELPRNSVGHIHFVLNGSAGSSQVINYSSFLAAVRNAVSRWVDRNGGLQAQSGTAALLQVTLEADGRRSHLWIDAQTLYVWGFSNHNGRTWAFNNHVAELRDQIARSNDPFNGIDRNVQSLGFAGRYDSIGAAANRNRMDMTAGWNQVYGAIVTLADMNNPLSGSGGRQQDAARSLQQLLYFVAEAARLNDVEGVYRAAMNGNARPVGNMNHELVNEWGHLSSLIQATGYGATGQFVIINWVQPNGTIQYETVDTQAEARRYVRVMCGGSCGTS